MDTVHKNKWINRIQQPGPPFLDFGKNLICKILNNLIVAWTKDGYSVSKMAMLLKKTEEFIKKVQEKLASVI